MLVTMGGTREPLDPVRYLGNRSSGRMGAAVVAEALRPRGRGDRRRRGDQRARPRTGRRWSRSRPPRSSSTPSRPRHPPSDVLDPGRRRGRLPAQAVGSPQAQEGQGRPRCRPRSHPRRPGRAGPHRRHGQVLVGFAAETQDHLAAGRGKLERKRADLIVVNHVEGAGSAFGADSASAYLVSADGDEPLPDAAKATVAARLLDWVQAHR